MLRICQKASFWLIEQGFLAKTDLCAKCGSTSLTQMSGRNGQQVMKCTKKNCRHTMNLYKKNALVRNFKLQDVLLMVYLWSEGIGFDAITRKTGIGRHAVSRLLADLQQAIMDHCMTNPPTMGGKNKVVEIDKTEVGKRRKGVKGTTSKIKMDVWGVRRSRIWPRNAAHFQQT